MNDKAELIASVLAAKASERQANFFQNGVKIFCAKPDARARRFARQPRITLPTGVSNVSFVVLGVVTFSPSAGFPATVAPRKAMSMTGSSSRLTTVTSM